MDYKNGKIYTIRSHQTDQIYIGSTCSPLSKRLYQHKLDYQRYINGKFPYITSFDILQFEDAYIELLEECPCENKMILHKREGELIRGGNNCVNKYIAGRTQKDWFEENKDKIKIQKKIYQDLNKDKIKKYQKNWYTDNKDEIREQRNEYKKEYRKQKKTCECGSIFGINDKARHLKTKKHLDFVNNNLGINI